MKSFIIWLIIAFTCAVVYIVLLQFKWASNGNPVNSALCACLPSVLLGAVLLQISYDLGLQTMIFEIYTNDMTAMKTDVSLLSIYQRHCHQKTTKWL